MHCLVEIVLEHAYSWLVLVAGPKPVLTDFGIHPRLENCALQRYFFFFLEIISNPSSSQQMLLAYYPFLLAAAAGAGTALFHFKATWQTLSSSLVYDKENVMNGLSLE